MKHQRVSWVPPWKPLQAGLYSLYLSQAPGISLFCSAPEWSHLDTNLVLTLQGLTVGPGSTWLWDQTRHFHPKPWTIGTKSFTTCSFIFLAQAMLTTLYLPLLNIACFLNTSVLLVPKQSCLHLQLDPMPLLCLLQHSQTEFPVSCVVLSKPCCLHVKCPDQKEFLKRVLFAIFILHCQTQTQKKASNQENQCQALITLHTSKKGCSQKTLVF